MNRIFSRILERSNDIELTLLTSDVGKPAPSTVVSASETYKSSYFEKRRRTRENLKKYWNMYSQDGTVFAAITTIATNVVMPGWRLESDNEQAKEYVEKYCIDTNLIEDKIFRTVRDALIFGDGIGENVFKNGELVANYARDPTTFEFKVDNKGIIKGIVQVIDGKEYGPILKPEQIFHVKFFERPDSPYGMSIIEPAFDTIIRKAKVDEGTAEAMVRHGHPKMVIYLLGVKDGETPVPTTEEINKIKTKLKDLNAKNEIILPDTYKIETIDTKGIERVEDYFSYFTQMLTSSFLVPEEALGLGKNVTEATSSTKIVMFERFIYSLQRKLSSIIEEQIFSHLLKNKFPDTKVHIKFRPITDKDEVLKARWISSLLAAYRNSDKMPLTINEIRDKFDLPPLPDGDDVKLNVNKQENG